MHIIEVNSIIGKNILLGFFHFTMGKSYHLQSIIYLIRRLRHFPSHECVESQVERMKRKFSQMSLHGLLPGGRGLTNENQLESRYILSQEPLGLIGNFSWQVVVVVVVAEVW